MKKTVGCLLSVTLGAGLTYLGSGPDVPAEVSTAAAFPNWSGGVDPQAWVPLLPPTTVAPESSQSVDSRPSEPVRRSSPVMTAPRRSTARPAVPAPSSARCGGPLPPCSVMHRESGGDPTVYNQQGSGASGKWQFLPGTWAGYGGYRNAADAPESVQDERARQVWAGGSGCSHWSAC